MKQNNIHKAFAALQAWYIGKESLAIVAVEFGIDPSMLRDFFMANAMIDGAEKPLPGIDETFFCICLTFWKALRAGENHDEKRPPEGIQTKRIAPVRHQDTPQTH